jgi:S1-C subfamily serine protease
LRKRAGFTVRETPNGFAVETVERGGPAEAAKLRPGMLLTAADEQPVDSLVSLAKAAFSHADEAPLRLGVLFLERAGYFVRRYEGEVAVRLR